MSDYHELLFLSLFDVFGWHQRGTARLLTACHTHRLDAETEILEKSGMSSNCQSHFFPGFDTALMKSAAEDFGSVVNEAFKGLWSNKVKSADTKTPKMARKMSLVGICCPFAAADMRARQHQSWLEVLIHCDRILSTPQVMIKHLWEPGGVTLGLQSCVCLNSQDTFCYGINTCFHHNSSSSPVVAYHRLFFFLIKYSALPFDI